MIRVLFTVLLLSGLLVRVANAELALKRVVLSSGGVGYFEYAADVDGSGTLGLDVPLEQVDDVLKSLVVSTPQAASPGSNCPAATTQLRRSATRLSRPTPWTRRSHT